MGEEFDEPGNEASSLVEQNITVLDLTANIVVPDLVSVHPSSVENPFRTIMFIVADALAAIVRTRLFLSLGSLQANSKDLTL
jgi:hypothetical protein